MIIVPLLLQNFEFELYDPDYQLAIHKTLTIKPKGFKIRATLREGLTTSIIQRRMLGGNVPTSIANMAMDVKPNESELAQTELKELLVCYGSNTGTCQTFAHTLARESIAHGFRSTIVSMDEAIDRITPDVPVIVITASYEGEPPDNAVKFIRWLKILTETPFAGGCHAVYGAGNRDWSETFQKIPTFVDNAFIQRGSKPLVGRGLSDAIDNNMFNEFDQWMDHLLWPALEKQYGIQRRTSTDGGKTGFEVIQSTRMARLLQDGGAGTVKAIEVLTAPGEPEKRHIKIQLPEGMTYTPGDYLAVLPVNPDGSVKEVMNRFGLAIDSDIRAKKGAKKNCDDLDSFRVYSFLREYVELNQVATEKVCSSSSITYRYFLVFDTNQNLECSDDSTIYSRRSPTRRIGENIHQNDSGTANDGFGPPSNVSHRRLTVL
jgi:cytochrome P450 / NADPH-cytochrome P450 reductase